MIVGKKLYCMVVDMNKVSFCNLHNNLIIISSFSDRQQRNFIKKKNRQMFLNLKCNYSNKKFENNSDLFIIQIQIKTFLTITNSKIRPASVK